tara:strand:- start:2342 stop:3817 length:1476 start_codon:yes stop_codon:yes gene_type:complete
MQNYTRISAQNSSNIVSGSVVINNIVDFVIPSGQVYDLSKSYISLPLRIDQSTGICENFILSGDNKLILRPESLIRNINVRSDVLGVIEDIKEVGFLRSVLNNYSDDRLEDERKNNVFGGRDSYDNYNSPFRVLRRSGNVASEKVTTECQIMLKDLIHFGNQSAYSTGKYGNLYVSLELDLANVVVRQVQAKDGADNIDIVTNWFSKQPKAVAGATAANRNAMVVGAVATTDRTLTTSCKYGDLAFSPFWVGQTLNVTLTGGTGVGTPTDGSAPGIIESIAFQSNANATNGSLVLTFSGPIFTGAGTPTAIVVVPVNQTATYSMGAPEMVMSLSNEKPPDMFEVLSFHTEADSGASGLAINKVYQVAPNAINVVVMSPQNGKGRSDFNALSTYRFRVDNKDVVDRVVGKETSIHYGILRDLFKRMGVPLLHIEEDCHKVLNTGSVKDRVKNVLIGCPLPDNNMPKLVDIEINSTTTGPAQIIVFSQIIKQF